MDSLSPIPMKIYTYDLSKKGANKILPAALPLKEVKHCIVRIH